MSVFIHAKKLTKMGCCPSSYYTPVQGEDQSSSTLHKKSRRCAQSGYIVAPVILALAAFLSVSQGSFIKMCMGETREEILSFLPRIAGAAAFALVIGVLMAYVPRLCQQILTTQDCRDLIFPCLRGLLVRRRDLEMGDANGQRLPHGAHEGKLGHGGDDLTDKDTPTGLPNGQTAAPATEVLAAGASITRTSPENASYNEVPENASNYKSHTESPQCQISVP